MLWAEVGDCLMHLAGEPAVGRMEQTHRGELALNKNKNNCILPDVMVDSLTIEEEN